MKNLIAVLLFTPLLFAVPKADAASYTRVVTTTTNECRDFTKTTYYANHTVSSTGTACLYPDGAWHDVTAVNEPIIQYESPAIVEQPVVYYQQPVYYNRPRVIYRPIYPVYDRFDHPYHYDQRDYNRGYGRSGTSFSINGRF